VGRRETAVRGGRARGDRRVRRCGIGTVGRRDQHSDRHDGRGSIFCLRPRWCKTKSISAMVNKSGCSNG
jgi:hypothetical protein